MVFFISAVILITGALHKKMEDIFLTEPLIALIVGIALGPDVSNVLKISDKTEELKILKIACEFTMAMALMATALRVPDNFYRKNISTQTTIVILGMVLMWLSSSFLLYWILEDFSVVECLLLGAIVTPTDPVVASTIVTGKKAKKYLPSSIRNSLSFESGSNDGLAFPIVLLSLFLVNSSDFPFNKWFTQTLLYETILCAFIAYVVGILAGKLMHAAHKKGFMNEKTLLPFSLGLAFLLLGGLNVLKMNGIIGVFIGGLSFAKYVSGNEDLQEERVQESMERIFTIPAFFIFGMILPWEDWFSLGWTSIGIVALVLFFRRIPAFLVMMPFMSQFRGKIYEILIMGWFGPIGIAALYYAIHSKEKAQFDEAWIIPSLIVFASTVSHGLTSVPMERIYYRKSGRRKKQKKENEQRQKRRVVRHCKCS